MHAQCCLARNIAVIIVCKKVLFLLANYVNLAAR